MSRVKKHNTFLLTLIFGSSITNNLHINLQKTDQPTLEGHSLHAEILVQSSHMHHLPKEIHYLISNYLYGTKGFRLVYYIKESLKVITLPILTFHQQQDSLPYFWVSHTNALCTDTHAQLYKRALFLQATPLKIIAHEPPIQQETIQNEKKSIIAINKKYLFRKSLKYYYTKDSFCSKDNELLPSLALIKKEPVYLFRTCHPTGENKTKYYRVYNFKSSCFMHLSSSKLDNSDESISSLDSTHEFDANSSLD